MARGYALTEAEARDFNRMRRDYGRENPPKARRSPRRRRHGGGSRLQYAKLTAALSAATAFADGATTATAVLMEADPANPGDVIEGDGITVTNRWVDLALASGKHLVVARIAGEWGIVASDCP